MVWQGPMPIRTVPTGGVRAFCFAGWFNLLGQAAVTAGIDFALASHIQGMWVLSNGYVLSQKELLAVYASKLRPSPSCSEVHARQASEGWLQAGRKCC